ncbi:MAG: glycine cleavage system protein GcvH [Acidobacteriota bacterium]|nr:glycine cleavage system protein GcvH [Acidobacteriota bacterium]
MIVKFTRNHEWIKADGGAAYIGITDFAQQHLSDIVFVELPKVGVRIEAGKAFASVESVKAVSDVYAPVSGTVAEVNGKLESAPELLNENAMENWMAKIELADAGELNALLDEASYEEFCKNEE